MAFLVASSLVCACSAGPAADVANEPAERPNAVSEAVAANDVLPATNFDISISEVDVLLANDNRYGGGFIDWEGLGVNVQYADPKFLNEAVSGGCTLGHASAGQKFTVCADGDIDHVNKPLTRTVQIHSVNDHVTVGVALDNIEGSSAVSIDRAAATAGSALSMTGTSLQAAGTIVGAVNPIAGAVIGVVGIATSVVGGLLGAPQQDPVSCNGGLVQLPAQPWAAVIPTAGGIPNKTLDTIYLQGAPGQIGYTGQQLLDLTSSGPATITFSPNITWPGKLFGEDPGTCNSSHKITLTIARKWDTGPAAGARSGDSAVALAGHELDAFYVSPKHGDVMRRYFDPTNGWRTQPIAHSALTQSTPFASVSRTKDSVDVFWADEGGNVMTAYWNRANNAWASRPALFASSVSHVPLHAPVAAVSRKPANIDVFYIGTDGALRSVYYADGAGYAAGPVSAANLATPGTGVAVVAPTANDLDVFFIGSNGQLWRSVWHEGNGWQPAAVVPNQGNVLAPPISGITATARTTSSLDAFYVANDGALHWATLQNGTWQADGTLAGDWAAGPVSPSTMPATPGGNVSAVVATGDAPEVDVAYTGRDLSTYVAKGPMAVGYPWQAWPTGVAVPAYDYMGNGAGRISLAAPTAVDRDVFIDSASRLVTAWSNAGSAYSVANLTLAKPAFASLAGVWNNGGATSIATYRSHGASFDSGSQWLTTPGFDTSAVWLSGDFNGDGLSDTATVTNAAGSNSIVIRESDSTSYKLSTWPGTYGGFLPSTIWLSGDFDGDGIDELAGVWNNGGNTNVGVCSPLSGCVQWSTTAGWDPTSHWVAGDFNGDGKTDIATAWNYGGTVVLAMRQSTGSSFAPSTWLTNAGGWMASTMFFAGDFTGDGKADVAAVWNNAGSTSVAVYGSTGSAFNNPVQWVTNAGWDSTSKWVVGDFNGDGKSDITTVWNYGGTNVMAMRQSTGSAFALGTWLTNGGGFMASTQWLGGKLE